MAKFARWIVLPNPQYGSWEEALYNFDYGLSRTEQLRRKRQRLDSARSETVGSETAGFSEP